MNAASDTAEWLELSGLPAALNALRQNGWLVFRKLVELDCRRNRYPEAVECSLGEIAERCGLSWEKTRSIIEALRRKKYVACFLPDNPDEPGLFQIRTPIRTPRPAEQVALLAADPLLRDPSALRYARPPSPPADEAARIQRVLDLYLNTLSQRLNSFIVDEIEMLARRFPPAEIERMMARAARHEIGSIGWVARELIREERRKAEKAARQAGCRPSA